MTPKEFFYAVAEMREAQKRYFKTHDRRTFLACRALENNVDREIRRVKAILDRQEESKDVNYAKKNDEYTAP